MIIEILKVIGTIILLIVCWLIFVAPFTDFYEWLDDVLRKREIRKQKQEQTK